MVCTIVAKIRPSCTKGYGLIVLLDLVCNVLLIQGIGIKFFQKPSKTVHYYDH